MPRWPAKAPVAEVEDVAHAPEFTFQFRRHVSGPFPGLWELKQIHKDGPEILRVDADNLSACLDYVTMFFEEAGH